MPRYIHPHSLVPREWLYHATIYPPPLFSSKGVIISSHDTSTPTQTWDWLWGHYIFTPEKIWWGGENIVMSVFHSQQYLEGMIISWHYIFTPGNIWWGGDCIVTLFFHSWQYLVRGWLYRDITFSLLTIFGQGVIILWHNILTPDNICSGGDYFVTSYFHSWQYFVRGWLYHGIVFSLLAIFGEGVIISWHIFTPDNI